MGWLAACGLVVVVMRSAEEHDAVHGCL